jgi:hypothetical protein
VNNTREFLRSLLDTKKTPRVPRQIRLQAYALLKHFPSEYDMEKACKLMPEVFQVRRGK